jgi:hypothetical protein
VLDATSIRIVLYGTKQTASREYVIIALVGAWRRDLRPRWYRLVGESRANFGELT